MIATNRERVVALAAQGLDPSEIAQRLGVSLGVVRCCLLPRQQSEVAHRVIAGMSDRQIATDLKIAQTTVRSYFESACNNIGLAGAQRKWLFIAVYQGYEQLPVGARA